MKSITALVMLLVLLLAVSMGFSNFIIHMDFKVSAIISIAVAFSAIVAIFMWKLSNDCVTLVQSSLDK